MTYNLKILKVILIITITSSSNWEYIRFPDPVPGVRKALCITLKIPLILFNQLYNNFTEALKKSVLMKLTYLARRNPDISLNN